MYVLITFQRAGGTPMWRMLCVEIFQPGAHMNLAIPDAGLTSGLKTGDFTLKFGSFALGGIGTATFGAVLLHALLRRRT